MDFKGLMYFHLSLDYKGIVPHEVTHENISIFYALFSAFKKTTLHECRLAAKDFFLIDCSQILLANLVDFLRRKVCPIGLVAQMEKTVFCFVVAATSLD